MDSSLLSDKWVQRTLMSSGTVRQCILDRMQEQQIGMEKLAIRASVPTFRLKDYLAGNSPKAVTLAKVLLICDLLGIDLGARITIQYKPWNNQIEQTLVGI